MPVDFGTLFSDPNLLQFMAQAGSGLQADKSIAESFDPTATLQAIQAQKVGAAQSTKNAANFADILAAIRGDSVPVTEAGDLTGADKITKTGKDTTVVFPNDLAAPATGVTQQTTSGTPAPTPQPVGGGGLSPFLEALRR